MEKTKHSVVKHLIAVAVALLLFGSSGGVAWGQLSGPTGFDNTTAHTTIQERCDGVYTIQTWTWYADNNFGPGETGTITPLTSGRSQNRGYHKSTNLGVNTLNPFSPGACIITVGGTQNIVQNVHNKDHLPDGCSDSKSWSLGDDGSQPTVEDWGSFSQDHTKWNGTVAVSSHVDLYAGDKPNVPDGTGLVTTNGSPASYTHETKIIVDGRTAVASQIKSDNPWELQIFNFMKNPWYYNKYTLQKTTNPVCEYVQRIKWGKRVKTWHSTPTPGHYSYDYTSQGWLTAHCTHPALFYTRDFVQGTNDVNARIQLVAGSHVRLMGHNNKSITSVTPLGGTTAYLNLPDDYYTLMNDWDVELTNIVYNSNGTDAPNDTLGKNAVFGINKQLDKPLKTNAVGGTFLIGGGTNSASQGNMTVTASDGSDADAGTANGFAVSGNAVYTGTCIPKAGTANVGNYQAEHSEKITILPSLNLPSQIKKGALQIFNTNHELEMQQAYTTTLTGEGNMLIMAKTKLNMTGALNVTIDAASKGVVTLAGGEVELNANEDYTGNSTNNGSYGVFAYGGGHDATPIFNAASAINWGNTCAGNYSWCGDPKEKKFLNTIPPGADVSSQQFTAGLGGIGFTTVCFTNFAGSGNIISANGSSQTTSTVTLTGKSNARWQAANDIEVKKQNTYTWTNKGEGVMSWIAGHDILPQGTVTWKKETASSKGDAFWQAGHNIEVQSTNNLTANWDADATDNTGVMRWLAGNDIIFPSGATVTANWKTASTASANATSMIWEAKNDIHSEAKLVANWEIASAGKGNLRWLTGRDINIKLPSGSSVVWKSGSSSTGNMEWTASGNIIEDNNSAVTFSFTQEGETGNTRWLAIGDINASGKKTFTNRTTGNGNPGTGGTTIWNARENIITGNGSGNNAPQLVRFERTTDQAGLMAWQAGKDIRVGSKTEFENNAANNISNMEWFACDSILTHYTASGADAGDKHSVLFKNDGKGNMIWHAQSGNISTRSKTTFENSRDGNMTWYAKKDIKTYYGTSSPSTSLGDGIIFTQTGKGRTVWWADDGSIETYNPVHFDWTQAGSDTASIVWRAGTDIEIGNNYNPSIPGQSRALFDTNVNDTILLKTRDGHILTNSQVDIERSNTGAALTKLWAGCQTYKTTNNIDIENVFNYTEKTNGQAAGALVHLYAENDILSNQDAITSGCDARKAPITFTLLPTSKTITKWEAERNINTDGRVDFLYGDATDADSLTWLSRGGYIQTERPVTIKYKSTKPISFLAEDWRHDATHAPAGNFASTGRRGNIHFYDSVDIKRNNQNGGLTQIKAENHIWTAMLNYVDKQSTGDTMDIISHKGDIYLGYNDGNTSNLNFPYYVANSQNGNITQKAPSAGCPNPAFPIVDYNRNRFTYNIPAGNTKGHLWIKAGWEEKTDRNAVPDSGRREDGGNIYFTHIDVMQATGSNHPTVISIPFSGLWRCGAPGDSLLHSRPEESMQYYENAGIISGVNHCLTPYPSPNNNPAAKDTGLVYRGAKGDLTVDAGNRGNIIFNKGAYVSFQDPSSTGNSVFRTRFGDIDMRNRFNVDTIHGSMLFLAQRDNLSDLSKTGICGCDEERNNVYLQDFQYKAHEASGSIFVGADNNIKLNYGGLQNMGTRHDPFLSKYFKKCKEGYGAKWGHGYLGGVQGDCGKAYHCDAVEPENQARPLVLNFEEDDQNKAITKGGFAAVASDYIDVYKKMVYRGGRGSGMGSVPGTGTLHGETVNGYGLFMKTQANKNNWTINIFHEIPKCPTTCAGENCDRDYLHLVSRLTFHDDADIEAQNQKVMLWSPVIETYGKMTLNTKKNSGNNTEITLKADSLIFHDDFVKIGNKTKLSTWSGLKDDKPVMKFGHMRHKPPFVELKYDDCSDTIHCAPCHYYIRGSKDPLHMMDTITIKFGDDAYLDRLNTVVFDHTVLTCLTDSFDHIKGAPVLNAMIRTDTMKVRNQVDLFADKNHERDAHLELISERQMGSKDYAGIYTKHLHMEPIGACGTPYSELWTSDDLALDVITTSIFGGFGFIHSDVHVENGAHLNAGFTSLRLRGLCYEQLCGTQRMKDLRLDVGAQLHFSVGTTKGLNGEYSDAIEVEKLTTYGSVDVNIEIRPCEKMEKRCYPIIYYKSLTPNSLNNLKVKPATVKIDGQDYPLHLNIGTDGIVYVCVGDAQPVDLTRTVTIPTVAGVKTDPAPGIWEVKSRGNFKFKATYTGKPLAVRTSRMVNGAPEMLTGKKNANGEYEYVIPHVQEDITLTIGPDFVANELLAGTAVWSHGEMIYIRVDRADIASIYSVAGQLVRKIDLPEGDTSIPMSRGAYVITLKDGSVHKVIVK